MHEILLNSQQRLRRKKYKHEEHGRLSPRRLPLSHQLLNTGFWYPKMITWYSPKITYFHRPM